MTTPRSPIVSLIGVGIGLVIGTAIYYTGDFENITKTSHCESDSDTSESCQIAKQIGEDISYSFEKTETCTHEISVIVNEETKTIYTEVKMEK